MTDLYRINLNLLVALDTALSTQSVSLAANKLSITQSAMSNNLQQLRVIFKDELLIRTGKKMSLTHYAKVLQPRVHALLQELDGIIFNGKTFSPETSKRIFRLGMPDYLISSFLPKVLCILQKKAPGIRLLVKAISTIDNNDILENDCDLLLGKLVKSNDFIQKQLLFKDKIVCVMSNKNPLATKKSITLEDYLSQKHVGCLDNNTATVVDQALHAMDKERDIRIQIPYIIPTLKMLEESSTDLLMSATSFITKIFKKNYKFTVKDLPFSTNPLEFYMAWHPRLDNDPAHQWIRDCFLCALKELKI